MCTIRVASAVLAACCSEADAKKVPGDVSSSQGTVAVSAPPCTAAAPGADGVAPRPPFALLTVGGRGSAAASPVRRWCAATTASSGDGVSKANAGAPLAAGASAAVSGLSGCAADALNGGFADGGAGMEPFSGLAGTPACRSIPHLR